MYNFSPRVPFEALTWAIGLIALAVTTPSAEQFTICPFYNLGFDFCPGCGLGRSISYLFRGEIQQSLRMHPLGLFAVVVLSLRIFRLTQKFISDHGKGY